MKKINYILFILVLFAGCEESDLTNFSERDAVYFQLEKTDFSRHYSTWDNWLDYKGDSLEISFGGVPVINEAYKEKDTVWLQVNVLGNVAFAERSFKVIVNSDKSTAQEEVHYEALKSQYVLPSDTSVTSFPLVIYNHESLGGEPLVLSIELEESEDFILGLEGRISARLLLYNDVTKPLLWSSFLRFYLGPYSKVKHRIILDLNGGVLLPNTWTDYYAIGGFYVIQNWRSLMNEYLENNEVYDENEVRITPW